MQDAFSSRGEEGLVARLKYMFQEQLAKLDFSKPEVLNHTRLGDLRYPYEWFPSTRTMQREIHFHLGPTNSGKTYQALKRLEEASSGVYAGPLRLLAHEVYTRFNAIGKKCNLITGDEVVFADGLDAIMNSCTIEMVPLEAEMEVAVVDEIQMLGDDARGWAWTQVLLGVKAKEVHLCGEERTLPLIERLAAAMGEPLIVHRYERLNPLKAMSTSLEGKIQNLRKGDCIVAFTKQKIHKLKEDIERTHGRRAAVVYGSLPPEVRAEQAKLFNDPTNDYDFLVASDAVGMGLNLSIKRIVFETMVKIRGPERRFSPLDVSTIKQIGGRAGRFRIALVDSAKKTAGQGARKHLADTPKAQGSPNPPSVGLITTLQRSDLLRVQRAMHAVAPPIEKAVIKPPDDLLARFAGYYRPNTPLSYIYNRFMEISQTQSLFRHCSIRDQTTAADIIQEVPGLTVAQRVLFCHAPCSSNDKRLQRVTRELATCIAKEMHTSILDLESLNLEVLDSTDRTDESYMTDLELLCTALTLYIWLSYRFTDVFTSQALAFYAKGLAEAKMQDFLVSTFPGHKRLQTRRVASSSRKSRAKPSRDLRPSNTTVSGARLNRRDDRSRSDVTITQRFKQPLTQSSSQSKIAALWSRPSTHDNPAKG